ncbi:MAG: hypothetical protein LBN95_06115, partial [Prevotellaceae bacterium]|nr:hypothetical protein [Prevotellaceae bacterium]
MEDEKILEIYERVGNVLSTDEVEALKSDIVGAYEVQKDNQPSPPDECEPKSDTNNTTKNTDNNAELSQSPQEVFDEIISGKPKKSSRKSKTTKQSKSEKPQK